MKVKFYTDNGANIHSCRKSEWFDTVEDLFLEEGEWEKYTEDQKWEFAKEWADEHIEIGHEEKP